MASPSEELSQKAYQEAAQGVRNAVADNLLQQRGLLIASGTVSSPPEPDWGKLADEAINQRSINGIKLSDFPTMSNGKSIDDMVPTVDRIDLIAKDVAAGVKENTGSMGFLKGATIGQAFRGFFSMIQEKGFGAAISGLFNMIFGDGKSENATALTQSIAQVTATDISSGVKQRLHSHQEELGLSNEQIDQIGAQTQNSVRTQAGLPPIPVPGQSPDTGPVGPGGLSEQDNIVVQNAIRGQVLHTFGLKQEGGAVVTDASNPAGIAQLNDMAQAAGVPGGEFTQDQKGAIVSTMTTALHSVATSTPPITDPKVIQQQIKIQLDNNADSMGLGEMSASDRDAMTTMMANQATASYLKARPVDRAKGAAFETAVADENKRATQQLAAARIRPSVEAALDEKTPMMGELIGRDLTESERKTMTDTVTQSLAEAAANKTTDPTAIRDALKANLKANADKMGFGTLSADDQERLFTAMANESTTSYLAQTAGPEASAAFAAATGPETETAMGQLTNGAVRQKMFDSLAPEVLTGVEDSVIAGAQNMRDNLDGVSMPDPIKKRLASRMDALLKDKESPEGRAKILSFVAAMGGPNQAQREAMAKETSTAMVDVLTNPENKGKSKEELAPLMEEAVKARLTEKRAEIEGLGGKFKLDDKVIVAGAKAAADATRNMTEEQQAEIARGQGMMTDVATPERSFAFDPKRVEGFAQTMAPVVDYASAKEVFRGDIKLATQRGIMKMVNQEVKDSWVPGASTGLAINSGYAPNHYQSDYIAEQVADAVSGVMANPNIPAGDKASAARAAVTARLQDSGVRGYIDASFKDGGLANNKANRFVMGLYKYTLEDDHIQEIASNVEKEVGRQLRDPNKRAELAQLNDLMTPIEVEAPTIPGNGKPSGTKLAGI